MAAELALERNDKGVIGNFADVQATIQKVFPEVLFSWTTSGQDKLRIAKERGIVLPDAIRRACETLPSLLEGRAAFGEAVVEFGLGCEEPVRCIYVTPRGDAPTLASRLANLEDAVGVALSSVAKRQPGDEFRCILPNLGASGHLGAKPFVAKSKNQRQETSEKSRNSI